MVAVRHTWVAARWPVHVVGLVTVATMARSAAVRVAAAHRDRALVDVIAVDGVQMSVVEIVDVTIMLDRDVTAVGAVNVLVMRMCSMRAHPESFRVAERASARLVPERAHWNARDPDHGERGTLGPLRRRAPRRKYAREPARSWTGQRLAACGQRHDPKSRWSSNSRDASATRV